MSHDISVTCIPSLTLYSLSTAHAATVIILQNAHISLKVMCLSFSLQRLSSELQSHHYYELSDNVI
jgi:hypothetical protein